MSPIWTLEPSSRSLKNPLLLQRLSSSLARSVSIWEPAAALADGAAAAAVSRESFVTNYLCKAIRPLGAIGLEKDSRNQALRRSIQVWGCTSIHRASPMPTSDNV